MKEYRVAELFSGAGLMGGGFRDAGFKNIFAAELDRRAVETYNLNIEPVAQVWDVSNIKDNLEYEVLVAGPPCQGFSTLGRRDPKDFRNALSLKVFYWACVHQPKVVVIENVPQFLGTEYWEILRKNFAKEGYECISWVLNSADYGVAQNRRRSFTLFSRIGLPEKPKPLDKKITIRDAFQGLPEKANGINLHISPSPSKLAMSRIKLIPRKGDKRDLMQLAPELCPPSWARMGNQAVDVWGRMDYDKPANTLRCSFQSASKGRYLHPTQNRVISLREGARIQGIPDNWGFCGDRTSIARQIGNGVPVPLARAVASSVFNLLEKSTN